ncbi:hypothetical protein DL546_004953 [Coniochaeta pulveracea]|uniref:B30.2/SPRY domain-containing protein n=1 Tax=Coniochaeta pulveracea TaxID=177199 RepID=A0A420Y2V1_9PEZI|nr:hypothetical protein DL546_004953 [Coniochaeta pulveracea]
MASSGGTPPPAIAPPASLAQKRVLDDDHAPAVSSPLNPDVQAATKIPAQALDDTLTGGREKRTKKESLKKRESNAGFGRVTESGGGSESRSRATPDPKNTPSSKKAIRKVDPEAGEISPMRYKLAPPKPGDFDPPRGPVFTSHHEVKSGADGSKIEFFETSEHVFNKKNFHYSHCIADPAFPSSFYYRQTEPEPYGAHMSFEDTSTNVYFDKTARHITTDKGFRGARANVAVREGRWYWECKVTQGVLKSKTSPNDPDSHGHVRIGWARREASVDAPVGFDAYSYGIRDVAGQKVHMSRPKDFLPPGEDIREGDVIGLEIQLPSENLHRKVVQGRYNPAVDLIDEDAGTLSYADDEAPNIVRDRIPIRFKAHIYFEKIDYHTTKELEDLMNPSPMSSSGSVGSSEPPNPTHRFPTLRTLPNSYIKVYKNGQLMGTPWTNLLAFLPPASKPLAQPGAREGLDDGMLGYYPAVSVFRGGAAEVNFGPNFWYPPPGYSNEDDDVDMIDVGTQGGKARPRPTGIKPLSERYDEQIVEDVVYDIVDEVAFWMQDGGKVIDRAARDDKVEVAGLAAGSGREEIKELVQDD